MSLLLSTTGTPATVTIDDLGAIVFTHPVSNFDLLTEWTEEELNNSQDLKDAIIAGEITVVNDLGDSWNGIDSLYSVVMPLHYYFCANSDNQISTTQDLRRESNALTNLVPYIVPYDSTIVQVTARHKDVGDSWDALVLVNDVVQDTFTVDNSVNNNPKFKTVSISVNKGDRIRLRFSNASATIDYPQICIRGKQV